MAFQLSRGLIGQQAGLPAQAQPGLGQSNVSPNSYTSQQYNSAYATGQGPMGALPGSAPGAQTAAGVAPYANPQPQQVGNSVPYNTALSPEGDGNGFSSDSMQGKGPQQQLAPKPKAAPPFNLGGGNPVASGSPRATGNTVSQSSRS